MLDSLEELRKGKIPKHVAIIMDGNGRWAKKRLLPRIEGHRNGAKSVKKAIEESCRLGVRYLTLFSFSTENWNRDPKEVNSLMSLFKRYLDSELEGLMKNDIRLRAIGDLGRLDDEVRESLDNVVDKTKKNKRLDLILAVSYSGRLDIVEASKKIALKAKNKEIEIKDISEEMFSKSLWTLDIPDPDLLIRTSGEVRISNFLLWQLAYTEIVFIDEFWPDFDNDSYRKCVFQYQKRERRFGLSSEQINNLA